MPGFGNPLDLTMDVFDALLDCIGDRRRMEKAAMTGSPHRAAVEMEMARA